MTKLIKILIATLFITTAAYPQSGDEDLQDIHTLKALFIYNFTKYIEWPPLKPGAPFVIAVYGKTPVYTKLESLLKGRKIHNRPVEIIHYDATDTITAQIIYIPSQWSGKVPFIADKLANRGTLLITEDLAGKRPQNGINLVTRNDQLRFDLNETAIKKEGLKVASQLMNLAITPED